MVQGGGLNLRGGEYFGEVFGFDHWIPPIYLRGHGFSQMNTDYFNTTLYIMILICLKTGQRPRANRLNGYS
jgi:hypothetical protein